MRASKFVLVNSFTPHELRDFPDMPDQLLETRFGLIRQQVKLLCRECREIRATIPMYEGDFMYTLMCSMCGDAIQDNVDAEKLFVEKMSWDLSQLEAYFDEENDAAFTI